MSRSRRLPPLFEVMRETNPVRTPLTVIPVVAPPPPTRQTAPQTGSAPAAAPPNGKPAEQSTTGPRAAGTNGATAAATVNGGMPKPRITLSTGLTLRTTDPAAGEPAEPEPQGDEAPEPAAEEPNAILDLNRSFVVPIRSILIVAAGLLLVVVLVWSLAWSLGEQSGRGRYVATLDPQAGDVAVPAAPAPAPSTPTGTDPLSRPTTTAQSTTQTSGPAASPRQAQQPTQPQARPAEQPRRRVVDAVPGVFDPRGTGENYLVVESCPRLDDAEAIAVFLTAQGLPAGFVPSSRVDLATARANNHTGWEVFLMEGIPSGEYRASEQRRQALEARVKELGRQMRRETGSQYGLLSPVWKKY